MADETKTFTEDQHLAILADRVTKETAALTEQLATKESEKAEVETKLDLAESAKVAAEQAKEKAEQELADFKAEAERKATEGELRKTRIAAAKEAAAHLPETFFADETRLARIVAMDDDAFTGYVADLAASNTTGAPAGGSTPPRETAMSGESGSGGESTSSAASTVLLGRFGRGADTSKGA